MSKESELQSGAYQAMHCLLLEVPAPVHADATAKVYAYIDHLIKDRDKLSKMLKNTSDSNRLEFRESQRLSKELADLKYKHAYLVKDREELSRICDERLRMIDEHRRRIAELKADREAHGRAAVNAKLDELSHWVEYKAEHWDDGYVRFELVQEWAAEEKRGE